MSATKLKWAAVALAALILIASSPRLIGAELPALPADFTRLHALVRPRADESQVEQVPWAATIWEARIKAAAEGKPIFIWVTGGPPGGC